MMYYELYDAWKREHKNDKLESLPSSFYSEVADHLRKLEEECRMLDKGTVKAQLLKKETRNVKRMVCELAQIRYKKLLDKLAGDKRIPPDLLTVEEKKIYLGFLPFIDEYQNFLEKILRGHISEINVKQKGGKNVLRFLGSVPSIVGLDMNTYGPFELEDVASLPVENCKILVKKGLAERIEA